MTTQSFSALQYAYIHAYIVCISPCIQASGWGLYREPLVIPTLSAETNTDYSEIGTNESKQNLQDRLRGRERRGLILRSLVNREGQTAREDDG